MTLTGIESSGQCTVMAVTICLVSVIITALLVAGISLAIHIAVYQCVYKSKLRSLMATAVTSVRGHNQRESINGQGDSVVYEIVDQRVGTMMEIKENEAYSVGERAEGLKLKKNNAYGARST